MRSLFNSTGPWPPLRNTLHVTNWTSECKPTTTRSSKMWSLQAPHHHYTNIASPLPSLGRLTVRGDIRWGETVVFKGEYCHIPGSISTKISEVAPQGCSNATPKTVDSSASMGGKDSFPLSIVAHDSKKRSSWGESTSSHEDRSWKKVRSSNKLGDVDLVVLEIPDSVDSPLRTLTVPFKESNYAGALSRGGSQESGESVSSPNPIKSSSADKIGKKATSICRDRSVIQGKIFQSDVDCASSLKVEVQVILEKMDGKDVDVSLLMRLVKSFFELAAIYDQERSTLHDKDMEAARKELFLSLSKVKGEIEKLSQKEKDLEVLLEATEKEIEEAKLGVSTAEKDFDACNDSNLLNGDDLTDLELKRERLEAMRQDLINYKL
ncbi:hypothetical protein HAX54_004959, partial [Datura stramonium]|nr:hypothetical protein [Datura stramonium]